LQQYVLAAAYVRLTVRFSKEPLLTNEELEAERKRRAALEDVLARFDELVEKALEKSDTQPEPAPQEKEQ
ncbi:MAG: hypothetical protein ACI9R3_003559, partial [Verrucomicrobiales bacterium]